MSGIYNRCKECYNMECIFVTGEREDIDTSECSGFRPLTNADRIRAMSDEELARELCEVETGVKTYGMGVYSHWLDWLKSPVEEAANGT